MLLEQMNWGFLCGEGQAAPGGVAPLMLYIHAHQSAHFRALSNICACHFSSSGPPNSSPAQPIPSHICALDSHWVSLEGRSKPHKAFRVSIQCERVVDAAHLSGGLSFKPLSHPASALPPPSTFLPSIFFSHLVS